MTDHQVTDKQATGNPATGNPALVLILMGVSGCGKSTIGHLLADRLGWPLLEGDEFHSAANIAKMREAVPLNDADRRPWLEAIAAQLADWYGRGQSGLVTCSALKRIYRDCLVADCPSARFIHLKGDSALIRPRLVGRFGHFMPVDLLDSQFAALQEPGRDEKAITVMVDRSPDEIAAEIQARLSEL